MLSQDGPENLNDQAVVKFVFELDQLKFTRRSGWHHIGADPESVAEHSQRASALAYFLAVGEKHPNPELVVAMTVFHDVHEARTGDDDLVQKQYVKIDDEKAVKDQMAPLGSAGAAILQMWHEVETRSTPAGNIAKDADILEAAFAAREMVVCGFPDAQIWIDAHRARLRTETAKRLIDILDKADPSEWWKSIFNGNYTPPKESSNDATK